MVNKFTKFFIFGISILWMSSVPVYAAILNQTTISAPFADLSSTSDYTIPLGWGVMDPNLIVDSSNNWYATLWYPCNSTDKKIYCLKIIKNGTNQSPEYRLDTYKDQGLITYAYQPPILFHTGNAIRLAHWALTDQAQSLIVTTSISLTNSGFGDTWQIGGVFSQSASYNYLGGALGPDGELIIAGWSQDTGLKITRSYPPYITSEQTSTEAMSSRTALYSHVAAATDSRLAILSVDSHYTQKCAEVDQILTSYKNIHYYEGSFATLSTSLKLSDQAPDFTNYLNYNPCAWRNMRFPLDLFYDAPSDRFFFIVLRSDLNHAYTNYASNNDYSQTFHLQSSDGQINLPDVSTYFGSLGFTGNDFDGFRLTRIESGEYALVGSSLTHKLVSTVFTRDFVTFSPPQTIKLADITAYDNLDVSHASYIRPQVFQPNKNSLDSRAPANVHIWFSPYTYSQPNYFLRYTHVAISSNLNSSTTLKPGDLNKDGRVNILDFNLLIANFGNPYTILDFNVIVINYER